MPHLFETLALKTRLAMSAAADQSESAIALMNHNGGKLEDLAAVLPLSDDVQYESAVAISWLDNGERTTEDLQAVLSLSDNTEYRSSIAQSWLGKGGREAKDFKVALPCVNDEQLQSAIALSWVDKEGRTSNDLQTVLPFVADEEAQSEIAVSWLNKGGRTTKDFQAVLQPFASEDERNHIAVSWLKKEGRTSEDLQAALPLVADKELQSAIAESWLKKEGITSKDLQAVLPFITDQELRYDITSPWIKKAGRTLEDFQTVLPLCAGEENQASIATHWLNQEGRTTEDLQAALPLITEKEVQSYLAESWSQKKGRTMEDVQTVLPLVTEKSTQYAIAESWIDRAPDPQTKYNNFTDFAKAGVFNDKYNTLKITEAYMRLSLPIDKLPSLGADLYPNNESMQVLLLKESMGKIYDDNDLVDLKPQLKSFIQNLHEDEFSLKAITAVRDRIELPPAEILEITKNRLSNKYESVSDLLNGKSLEESLNKEGLQSVRKLFSNDTSPIDIKLADLLSYYDVQNGLADFKSLLVPEVLQEVVEKFSPSSKTTYVSGGDFEKLSQLNNEATPESNITLPSVKIIADYLSSKVGDINKVLTPEEITTYQFGSSTTLQNEAIPNRREYLTEKFRNLLESENPAYEEVSEFFERALNPEVANPETEITARNGIINEENKGKLTLFFNGNKHMLASLFQQEDGLDNFAGTITSLGHGCVANISTQARTALFQSLITDPNDQALFGVFREKISGEILNSGGDLLMSGDQPGVNIFNNPYINDNFISPNGLLTAISEEFYSNGKIKKDAVEFVKQEAGEDVRGELANSVLENNDYDVGAFNQEMAKIAAYMIIQKTLPDLCENKYLDQPRAEYLAIIQAGQKQEEVATETVSKDFDDKTTNVTDASYQSVSTTEKHEVSDAVKGQVGDVLKALKRAHVNESSEEEEQPQSNVEKYAHHHDGTDNVTTH